MTHEPNGAESQSGDGKEARPSPEPLTDEALERMIRDGQAQIELMDEMEAALVANDIPKLIEVAREMVRLDHAHEGESNRIPPENLR